VKPAWGGSAKNYHRDSRVSENSKSSRGIPSSTVQAKLCANPSRPRDKTKYSLASLKRSKAHGPKHERRAPTRRRPVDYGPAAPGNGQSSRPDGRAVAALLIPSTVAVHASERMEDSASKGSTFDAPVARSLAATEAL
jgi:hypothetical protein